MKSSGQIYMDYRLALSRAADLDHIAEDMERLAKHSLQKTLQDISSNWTSRNAASYLTRGERLGSRILRTARQLREIAAAVRNVAKRTYNAEMRAYRIAMARKYKI